MIHVTCYSKDELSNKVKWNNVCSYTFCQYSTFADGLTVSAEIVGMMKYISLQSPGRDYHYYHS